MKPFSFILLCLLAYPALAQGEIFQLEDETGLYLTVTGEGQTMLFIPGWTMTHKFFEKQIGFFSETFQVIAYDPRGQGRSGKTSTGNNYAVHAADLRQILLKKNLDNVILIGWSSGCLTMYEYIRNYGHDRLSSMIFIDEPPKWIGDAESEWVYGSFEDYRKSLKGLISKPADPNGIINWMLEEPVDSLTMNWMRNEILMTPGTVSLSLYIDGLISDYSEEVTGLGSEIPALFMVRSSWYDRAESWLKTKAPHAGIVKISSHAMFWERPDEFNTLITDFIDSN